MRIIPAAWRGSVSLCVLASALTSGLLAAPAYAGAATAPGPVGGPRLGTRAVVVTHGAPGLPATLSASSWLVADLDTGAVLAAKDPHGRYAPASTIKTLTALTFIPKLDPAKHVIVDGADVDVDGSKVGLVPGASYTIAQLFTAMLVVSGNDAANALASAAGGRAYGVALMNDEAQRLRAGDTTVVNPSGLDTPGQATSAYDLALIARAGMALPDFRHYVGVMRSTIPAPGGKSFAIATHDNLLTHHYPGAIGIKNGYTVAARASFVGAARRGGHTIVVTLMRANPEVWKEAAALLDWGFRAEAAGTASIGQLVPPLPAPGAAITPEAALAGQAHASAVRQAQRGAGASVVGPGLARQIAAGVGLVVVMLVALRIRAVRRRRYRRLKLPRT